LFFSAEPESNLNAAQMEKINKHSLAILEFRMGEFAEETTTGRIGRW
jgi:hypothetical protein